MRLLVYLLLAFWATSVFPHAMPEKSDPGAGAELHQTPPIVSIRFDSELEPIFSRLIVKNAAGKQISDGNGALANADARMLTTKLTEHAKGTYHVYWSVVSRDGHRTEGDYTFSVD
jgi:methionine-rich copper-binding protein CopC